MEKNFVSKMFLTPYFAGCFVIIAMVIYFVLSYIFSLKFGFFDIEEIGITEVLTYLFYGVGLGVALCHFNDFSDKKPVFFAFLFLWLTAFLREMGIQHWLTSHDTVVTKTSFFLNPNNPLYEKLIAGFLMLLAIGIFAWVVIKYFKKLIEGIIKFYPVQWTFITFVVFAIITQIADRFPANYLKATGMGLSSHCSFVLKILEEGGESILPLLFAIAIVQYSITRKKA